MIFLPQITLFLCWPEEELTSTGRRGDVRAPACLPSPEMCPSLHAVGSRPLLGRGSPLPSPYPSPRARSALPEARGGHPGSCPAAPSRRPCSLKRDRSRSPWALGSPRSAPLGGGLALSVEVSRGRGHLSHLVGGSGSAVLAPYPQGGPNKPCVVFKASWRKSLCLPSTLSVLFQILKSCNPSTQVRARQHHTPDSGRIPPPPTHPGQWGSGAAEASKSQRVQMLGSAKAAWGTRGALGQTPWIQIPAGQDLGRLTASLRFRFLICEMEIIKGNYVWGRTP